MLKVGNKKTLGSLLLLLAALIWGFAFSFQDMAGDFLGAFAINGTRMLLGAIFLLIVLFIKNDLYFNKVTFIGGVIGGFALFLASYFQQAGISMYLNDDAAAGKSGFLTALYIVLVPIFSLFLKKKPSFTIIISLLFALPGMYLLCVKDDFKIAFPDVLVLLCAVCFAIQILIVEHFNPKTDPVKFSLIQLTSCGVYSLIAMFIFEENSVSDFKNALLPILFIGIFSCGIAYTLQVVAQKMMNEPSKASLIMSLESVFAVLAGALLLGEKMKPNEILGCILVFAAVIIAQIDPNKIKTLLKTKKE